MSKPNGIFPFKKIEDPLALIPVLKSRLPKSALLYNSVKMYPRIAESKTGNKTEFYSLYGNLDETAFIVYVHYREDTGNNYLISADKSKISKEDAFQALSQTEIFEWDKAYFFVALEKWISAIIFDISVNHKENVVAVHPCYMFYKDIEECLDMDIKCNDLGQNVELKRLDPELGSNFILKTWKYTSKNSDSVVHRALSLNESGGIYKDGQPVSGILTHDFGLLSALYTLEDHRKKGYANLSMQFAHKELAKNGLIPTSTVELRNRASISFHEKLACKVACIVDYIICSEVEF